MSRSRIKLGVCALLAATALTGCSEYMDQRQSIYLDRRDTIALSAGDSLRSNQVAQMVDPWPAHSANRNISFDGQKMQSAVERYQTNKIPALQGAMTSNAGYTAAPAITINSK